MSRPTWPRVSRSNDVLILITNNTCEPFLTVFTYDITTNFIKTVDEIYHHRVRTKNDEGNYSVLISNSWSK